MSGGSSKLASPFFQLGLASPSLKLEQFSLEVGRRALALLLSRVLIPIITVISCALPSFRGGLKRNERRTDRLSAV